LPGIRASTPDFFEVEDDTAQELLDDSYGPIQQDAQQRQKSAAALALIDPGGVLARLSSQITQTTADIIADIPGHYAVPEGEQVPGIESGDYRARFKRKADAISRSQYEVYSFSTKHNLSEAALDELLGMLSNVSVSFGNLTIVSAIMLGCVLLTR